MFFTFRYVVNMAGLGKMIEKPLRFNQGRLAGVLHLPKDRKVEACVITCHGLLSSKNSEKYLRVAQRFCGEVMAVFRFDFRGCGESYGRMEETTLTGRIEDLKAALELVAGMGFRRIGVMGSSLGGCVSILTAVEDKRIKALAVWATPSNLEETFSRETLGDFQKLLEDAKKYDVVKAVGVIGCPIIIIHGSLDTLVPTHHAKTLYENAKEPKSLHIIKGANHTFTNKNHREKAIELTLNWFKKHI